MHRPCRDALVGIDPRLFTKCCGVFYTRLWNATSKMTVGLACCAAPHASGGPERWRAPPTTADYRDGTTPTPEISLSPDLRRISAFRPRRPRVGFRDSLSPRESRLHVQSLPATTTRDRAVRLAPTFPHPSPFFPHCHPRDAPLHHSCASSCRHNMTLCSEFARSATHRPSWAQPTAWSRLLATRSCICQCLLPTCARLLFASVHVGRLRATNLELSCSVLQWVLCIW